MNQFDLLQFSNQYSVFNSRFSEVGFVRRELPQTAESHAGAIHGTVMLVPLEMLAVPAVFPKTRIAVQNRRAVVTDDSEHLSRYASLLINGVDETDGLTRKHRVLMIKGFHLFQFQDISHQTLTLLMTLGQKISSSAKDKLPENLSPALEQFNTLLNSDVQFTASLTALRDKIAPVIGGETTVDGLDLLAFTACLATIAKVAQNPETKDTDPGVLLLPIIIRHSDRDISLLETSMFVEGIHHRLTLGDTTGEAAMDYFIQIGRASCRERV